MAQPATWQDTATAVGTLLAVAVAVGVALYESIRAARLRRSAKEKERVATAGLVSAWVEETYTPNEDGSAYVRRLTLHLDNESNEPVFRVTVTVGVGYDTRSIGPLAVPAPVPVLPARRALSWDISLAVRAHDDTGFPCAEVAFTDSSDRRWLRKFDGTLAETTGLTATLMERSDPERGERQLGRDADPSNAMAVALAFLHSLEASEVHLDEFRGLLAPEARGWDDFDDDTRAEIAASLSSYGVGGFVQYPAPHVAYVKVVPEHIADHVVAGGDSLPVEASIVTLTYIPDRGWRVFSYGAATEPDRIPFQAGTLFED